jgi:hypothetical protein
MHTRTFSVGLVTLAIALATPAAAQQPTSGAVRQSAVPQGSVDPRGQLTVDPFALTAVDVGTPVKGAPYSADAATEIVQVLADGNRIVRRTSARLYRDSRGRTRSEVTLENIAGIVVAGAPLRMITISDPESSMTYFVDSDDQTRSPRTVPAPGDAPTASPPVSWTGQVSGGSGQAGGGAVQIGGGSFQIAGSPPGPAAYAAREESLGTRDIEGIRAEGTRTTVTIPAGAIGNERPITSVTERWFSPALRIVVLSRSSDPRFGTTTYRLTKISRTEPPASLFQRPAQ